MLLSEETYDKRVEADRMERMDAILKKYCDQSDGTLVDIEKLIEKDLGKKPNVTTDPKHQVIWIETDNFTIIGYYDFDEDTGLTRVNPQTVELHNEEPDFLDDPIYGLKANI